MVSEKSVWSISGATSCTNDTTPTVRDAIAALYCCGRDCAMSMSALMQSIVSVNFLESLPILSLSAARLALALLIADLWLVQLAWL